MFSLLTLQHAPMSILNAIAKLSDQLFLASCTFGQTSHRKTPTRESFRKHSSTCTSLWCVCNTTYKARNTLDLNPTTRMMNMCTRVSPPNDVVDHGGRRFYKPALQHRSTAWLFQWTHHRRPTSFSVDLLSVECLSLAKTDRYKYKWVSSNSYKCVIW